MCRMTEAAFQNRSLYLLCVRTRDMIDHLAVIARERGDHVTVQRFIDEAEQIDVEARKWYKHWEQAGGRSHAPITQHLPLRSPSMAAPGCTDVSNVIVFPVERCRRAS